MSTSTGPCRPVRATWNAAFSTAGSSSHVLHEPRVLDDRHRDAGRVDLLERVGADQARAHLAGDADERRRVHPRVGDRRHEVRRARARTSRSRRRPCRTRARSPRPCGPRPARGGRARGGRSCRARTRRSAAGSRRPGSRTRRRRPRLERAQDRVGAEHPRHAPRPPRTCSTSVRASGSSASTASVNGARAAAPSRRGAARDRTLERPRRRAALEPLREQQRQRSAASRVGSATPKPARSSGVARARREEPRARPRAATRARRVAGEPARCAAASVTRLERARASVTIDVEVARRLAQPDERLAEAAALDDACPPQRACSRVDDADATPARSRPPSRGRACAAALKNARSTALARRRGAHGAERRATSPRSPSVHARDAPHELQVGLHASNAGSCGRRDEDRVGARGTRRASRAGAGGRSASSPRRRTAGALRRARASAARRDATSTRVASAISSGPTPSPARHATFCGVHVHAATSWNTSARETRSPRVGEPLEARERGVDLVRDRARARRRRTHARTRGGPSACRAAASSSAPSSAGSMIWYVDASLSMPSWWMPASCANAFAPTIALLGCTT